MGATGGYGSYVYRGGKKNPLKGGRLTCTRSIDKGDEEEEEEENEERRTFPVWLYRQPDAISGGETLD